MDVRRTNGKQRGARSHRNDTTDMPAAQSGVEGRQDAQPAEVVSVGEEGADEITVASGPRPFAVLLSFLVKNERSEVVRLAREIGVSDNTVYRWLNGTAEPRAGHLQRLLEVLPRGYTPAAVGSASEGGRASFKQSGRWEVSADIYRRVLGQMANTVDEASRNWHIIGSIFEYALLHLDPERHGMALTYARLMQPREDGMIHSLYEVEMRGQAPWPFALDSGTYLGSTTLAGASALSRRVYTWSEKDEGRHPVGLDENERSSCTAPVMRGGRLAGVLIVSSAREDFVRDPAVPRAVADYANLLAVSLKESEFYPVEQVKLVPMPEIKWQREHITSSYVNRVVEYARKQCLTFPEAEKKVLSDLEDEFERYERTLMAHNDARVPPQSYRQGEHIS